MASDSSSGFRQGILHFFTGTKNATERVEGRTKEQYGLGSVPSTRKGSLCDDFVQLFVHLVDYRGLVFFVKRLQKPLEMPRSSRVSLLGICEAHQILAVAFLTSLTLSFSGQPTQSQPLSSALRCRLPLSVFLRQLDSVFSQTFLTPFTSGLVGVLALCLGFAPNRQSDRLPGAPPT